MAFTDAIRNTKDGVLIDLDVNPGARETQVPSGYNTWRKRIEARISAPAQEGRANKELIEALAKLFKVNAASIEVTAGATSGKKTVLVRELDSDQAIEVLGAALGE